MRQIGKYEVIRRIGQGAAGEVFLCNDRFNGREVAVKVLRGSWLDDPDSRRIVRRLFVTEAALVGKLRHPHIVQIHDAVVDDDDCYIAMEYVPGGTLEDHADPGRLLPVDRLLEIAFKCTRALAFAHGLGITHRDLKPANILYSGGSEAKVSDFGAAFLANADQTQVARIGTPVFMSPEQAQDQTVDHRSDIYALGVVLFRLLTGTMPYQAVGYSLFDEIIRSPLPPPSSRRPEVSPRIDAIVARATEKRPEARYQTWEEFSFELVEALGQERLAMRTRGLSDGEKFSITRSLSFFEGFTDAELWEVLRISRWMTLPAEQAVLRAGEPGDHFFVLASGTVKITKQQRLMNLVSAGECFGEMSYLSRQSGQRTADVTTVQESRVIRIDNADLDRLSPGCRHRFDRAFIALLVERLAMATDRLAAR